LQHYPTRKRADFLLVSDHERTWQIGLIGSADDGASWCNPKYEFDMGRHRLANYRGQCSPTPGAYREGGAAKEMEQGKSLATSSYALGQRPSLRAFASRKPCQQCQDDDGEDGKENQFPDDMQQKRHEVRSRGSSSGLSIFYQANCTPAGAHSQRYPGSQKIAAEGSY
jgi:hypothetical protein